MADIDSKPARPTAKCIAILRWSAILAEFLVIFSDENNKKMFLARLLAKWRVFLFAAVLRKQ